MNVVRKNQAWNTALYNSKHEFVFKYGEDLVDILAPQKAERILDLGCGTGYLTNLIAEKGANVLGIDNSSEMIDKAIAIYPDVQFKLASALTFRSEQSFDAIFSNAVLHWILEKDVVIERIYANLVKGGRIVIELGGQDNVAGIINAIKTVLIRHGFDKAASKEIWYFPSLSEYTSLLESRGFRVTWAAHYDRETELADVNTGIKDWVRMFGNTFFKGIDAVTRNIMLDEIQDILYPTHFRNGKWWADYKRLRIVAIKA